MDSALPPDLLDLKSQFDSWRETRSGKSSIPHHLRQAAIALLDRYSPSTICRVCRLNPRSLKTSAVSVSAQATAQAKTEVAFFHLPASSPPQRPAAECRLLLERSDGSRLTLVLPALDSASLSNICTLFLRL
jgi:hypothetical protein